MGALVAIEAALAWPDKVAGVVLCAAAPRLPVSRDLMKVIDEDYAHFPAWLAERALSVSAKPALRRAFVAAGVVAPQAVTRADFQAIAGTDLGARLSADRAARSSGSTGPTIAIVGRARRAAGDRREARRCRASGADRGARRSWPEPQSLWAGRRALLIEAENRRDCPGCERESPGLL